MNRKPLPKVSFQYQVKEGRIRRVKVPEVDPVVWTRREKVSNWFGKVRRRAGKANRRAWDKARGLYAHSISKVILAVVSWFVNPKLTWFFMIEWLKQRLNEPSTYRGIVALMTALGVTLNPAWVQEIIALAVAVLGFIEFARKEAEKKEAE